MSDFPPATYTEGPRGPNFSRLDPLAAEPFEWPRYVTGPPDLPKRPQLRRNRITPTTQRWLKALERQVEAWRKVWLDQRARTDLAQRRADDCIKANAGQVVMLERRVDELERDVEQVTLAIDEHLEAEEAHERTAHGEQATRARLRTLGATFRRLRDGTDTDQASPAATQSFAQLMSRPGAGTGLR